MTDGTQVTAASELPRQRAAGRVAAILLPAASLGAACIGPAAWLAARGGGLLPVVATVGVVYAVGGLWLGLGGLLLWRAMPMLGRGAVVATLLMALGHGTIAALILRDLHRTRGDVSAWHEGNTKMAELGRALLAYAGQNGGAFPAALSEMAREGDGGLTLPTGGGAYVYYGYAIRLDDQAVRESMRDRYAAVLLHEPMAEGSQGANFLYANGKVKWAHRDLAARIIGELRKGVNPPRKAVVAPSAE